MSMSNLLNPPNGPNFLTNLPSFLPNLSNIQNCFKLSAALIYFNYNLDLKFYFILVNLTFTCGRF